jgi:hypothetical protein
VKGTGAASDAYERPRKRCKGICQRLVYDDMMQYGMCAECLSVMSKGHPNEGRNEKRMTIVYDPSGTYREGHAQLPLTQFEAGLRLMTLDAGTVVQDSEGNLLRVWESAGTKQWIEPE